MLYFGYGSNIKNSEMDRTCNEFTYLGIAKLEDYKLEFTRYSENRSGGVADIVESGGIFVLGALYKINTPCALQLDKKEGIGFAYKQVRISVLFENNLLENVLCYSVINKQSHIPPSTEYKQIMIDGMEERAFPENYIMSLRQIQTSN